MKKMRVLSFLSLLGFLFVISVRNAEAAMITIDTDGQAFWNVLAYEDDPDLNKDVEVKSIVNTPTLDPGSKIALTKKEDKVLLTVNENEMDISGYDKEIVEIEEVDIPKRVAILADENGFSIQQRGIVASTDFPISVNTPERKLAVKTKSGIRYLSILPYDAVVQMVRTNIISDLSENIPSVELVENESGEVIYKVKGVNELKLLKFVDLSVEVNAEVSAISGKVLKVDKPLWYAIADFLVV